VCAPFFVSGILPIPLQSRYMKTAGRIPLNDLIILGIQQHTIFTTPYNYSCQYQESNPLSSWKPKHDKLQVSLTLARHVSASGNRCCSKRLTADWRWWHVPTLTCPYSKDRPTNPTQRTVTEAKAYVSWYESNIYGHIYAFCWIQCEVIKCTVYITTDWLRWQYTTMHMTH
jgi:hypothetical protein